MCFRILEKETRIRLQSCLYCQSISISSTCLSHICPNRLSRLLAKHRMLFHAYSRILSDNALHRAAVFSVSGFSEERDRSNFRWPLGGRYTVKILLLSERTTQPRVARTRATCERRILIFHRQVGLRLLRTLSGYHTIGAIPVPTSAAYTYI